MLGGADNPNGELPSYITGADIKWVSNYRSLIRAARLRAVSNEV